MDVKNIIFQVPATITKLTSMSHGSWRLQIDTQENITPDDISKLSELKDKLGWFTFVKRKDNAMIKPDDLIDLPPLIEETLDIKKSLSERLRNVLFVRYTKSGGKKEDFEVWRIRYMERLIQSEKDKIPQDEK
jgi:hypothetical protein